MTRDPGTTREGIHVHHNNEVRVFTDGPQGRSESPAGVGWLVSPSVVVMRLSGRGATPGQPSHITVPAASGGGRGKNVPVLGVFESTELDGWIALQLDADVDAPDIGMVPDSLDLSGVMTTEQPTIDRPTTAREDTHLRTADLSGAETTTPSALGGEASVLGGASALGGGSTDGWICRCFPSLPGCRR